MSDGYWRISHEEKEFKRWTYAAYNGTNSLRDKYELFQKGNKFSLAAYNIPDNSWNRKPYLSKSQVKMLLYDLGLTPLPWDTQDMSCIRHLDLE